MQLQQQQLILFSLIACCVFDALEPPSLRLSYNAPEPNPIIDVLVLTHTIV